jgi:hypothetical protein
MSDCRRSQMMCLLILGSHGICHQKAKATRALCLAIIPNITRSGHRTRGAALPHLLSPIDFHSLLEWGVRPFSASLQSISRGAENQLTMQRPTLRDVPLLLDALCEVWHKVIMLQITPQTLQLKRCPGDELMHSTRLVGPCYSKLVSRPEMGKHAYNPETNA